MKLRDYQIKTVETNYEFWFNRGYQAVLNHLATGLGKTVIAVETAKFCFPRDDQRILFVVNFSEVVRQSRDSFVKFWPELKTRTWGKFNRPGIGIVMGRYNDAHAKVVVATPQTLSNADDAADWKRLNDVLKYGVFDLVVFDEAHYTAAISYLRLRDKLVEANPNVKILGMTATPLRADGLALSQIYQVINVSYPIKWGIRHGYLCPIQPPKLIETNIELPEGEGAVEDRAKAIDVKNWSEVLCSAYREHGENRPGLWFMPSVEHSREFVKYMQSQGYSIAHVDAEGGIDQFGNVVSANEREMIIAQYKDGAVRMLSNYSVLVAGFDAPHTSFIGLARPTENEVLVTQIIGRGTRIAPHKKDLLVLDFALKGVSLLTAGSLLGHTWQEKDEPVEDESEVETLSDGLDLRDLRDKKSFVNGNGLVVRIGNLFKNLEEAWYADEETIMSLSCSDTEALVIVPPNYTLAARIKMGVERGEEAVANDPTNRVKADFLKDLTNAYELFSQFTLWRVSGNRVNGYVRWNEPVTWTCADETIEGLLDCSYPLQVELSDPALSKKKRAWRRELPTPAQARMLKRLGVNIDPETKGEASQIIAHYLVVPLVKSRINEIRLTCGKYGVVHNELEMHQRNVG